MDIVAEPRLLSLGQVSPGETVKRELRLRVQEPGVTITDVKALDERVSLERTSKDEHLYDVVFAGQDDLGSISNKIRVEYTGGQADHFDVTVWGSVVGDLTYPRQLSFRREGEAFRSQTLRIKSRSGKTVRVLSATDPDGKVTARVTKPSGTTAEIELTVAEGTTDPGRGKIRVRTNDSIEPTVEVGYYLAPKRRVGNTRVRPRGSARRLEK